MVHSEVTSDEYSSFLSLKEVKWAYYRGDLSLEEALSFYPEWVKQDSYIILWRIDHSKPLGDNRYLCKYKAVKMAKRGNDVYRWRVRKRFSDLKAFCRANKGFSFISGRSGYSNLLFVTLTFNTNLTDVDNAWNNIGKDLNLFLSHLKQEYGRIFVLRCFEAHKNGYPHVHLIIGFLEHKFPVKRRRLKSDGFNHYLLTNKSLNRFSSFWHSFVKVEGVSSLGAVGYLLKYITKDMYLSDGYKTASYLWLFHKQSYGFSRGFTPWLSSILPKEPTQLDTIMPNSNKESFDWSFLCVVNANFHHDKWVFEISEDPPWDLFDRSASFSDIFASLV